MNKPIKTSQGTITSLVISKNKLKNFRTKKIYLQKKS